MIWLALLLVAALALAPLLAAALGPAAVLGAREPALALQRAQLAELDRDRAEGRLPASEHAAAVLEVQRRLLATADAPETATRRGGRGVLLATSALVVLAAAGLYLVHGMPEMPSATATSLARRAAQDEAALAAQLRARLASLDPASEPARTGYLLLGNVEEARGNQAAAAAAFRQALSVRFEPVVAVRAAIADMRARGGTMTEEDASLLRRALAEAPADAPWRGAVAQALADRAAAQPNR